jgi:hypothetical protein
LSSQVRFFNSEARPHARNEVILVDYFAGVLNQSYENFEGPTSKRNRIIALKQ